MERKWRDKDARNGVGGDGKHIERSRKESKKKVKSRRINVDLNQALASYEITYNVTIQARSLCCYL